MDSQAVSKVSLSTLQDAAESVKNFDIGVVSQSLAPSHILADGRFVNLPDPTERERARFFERTIAKHKLLEKDLLGTSNQKDKDGQKENVDDEDDTENDNRPKKNQNPQIHPLALASAKLQSDGISELNRAINLQTLAMSGEYFGLSSIVDPSLELLTTTTPSSTNSGIDTSGTSSSVNNKGDNEKKTDGGSQSIVAATNNETFENEREIQQEQRLKASFILKRKRSQFEHAGLHILRRHRRRLEAAIVAQSLPDQRLRALRPFWRLVAPEHGTRALPHATRPSEVVAADVDVYRKEESKTLGRLASRVPRYATIELHDDYEVQHDLKLWKQKYFGKKSGGQSIVDPTMESKTIREDRKNGFVKEKRTSLKSRKKAWTRAEPFAIADPAHGKLDADFDPSKVAMLTLQFDIEKTSTGFVQSACLEPIATASLVADKDGNTACTSHHQEDEKLLVSLQHSLFCAKLFESIRRELAPDTEDIGQIRTTARQSLVWLSGESEENYLPAPSLMINDKKSNLSSLCVVHVHEGDAKVLLDCEYALRIRLVEANEYALSTHSIGNTVQNDTDMQKSNVSSGSQNPEHLQALCRALLLHAQETYHRHSVAMEAKLRKEKEMEKEELLNLTPHQMQQKLQAKANQMKSKEHTDVPKIFASCVSLGSKMLFERRIRVVLSEMKDWIKDLPYSTVDDKLLVEWLPLSIFDLHAQFTVAFRNWCFDASITCDEMTVTQFGTTITGKCNYRKVKFRSADHFELFMKVAVKKVMKETMTE